MITNIIIFVQRRLQLEAANRCTYSNDQCYEIERHATVQFLLAVTHRRRLLPPSRTGKAVSWSVWSHRQFWRQIKPIHETICKTIDRGNTRTQVHRPPQGETATWTRHYGERRDHTNDWTSHRLMFIHRCEEGWLSTSLSRPRGLNDNLKRCAHTLPTLEELNPEFAETRVFSKMDAKAGYWSIHLDEASQQITISEHFSGVTATSRIHLVCACHNTYSDRSLTES